MISRNFSKNSQRVLREEGSYLCTVAIRIVDSLKIVLQQYISWLIVLTKILTEIHKPAIRISFYMKSCLVKDVFN